MAHKELHCPDCGSDRVRITDHQPLATNDSETKVDSEIYVSLNCEICGEDFNTTGDITYRQPQYKRKVKVLLEFSVNYDTNNQEFLEAIHNALLLSNRVTRDSIILKESFVD